MALVRRLLRGIVVLWLAVTLVFFALRILPGDALLVQLVQSGVGADAIDAQRAALGLTNPPLVQYGQYLAGLLRGDLGNSILSGLPVTELIAQQFQPTIVLAVSALALAVLLGVGLGTVAAMDG